MDIDHLPPQRLSSDSTLSGWTLYPEQVFDYAGGSYVAPHHVNEEQQHDYQQLQYGHSQIAYYVTAQTDTPQNLDLPPADAAIRYWPTAQVPATDLMSTTLPMEPLSYFPSPSYYGNHDLSSHQHQAPVDQFHSIPHTAYAETYGAAGYPDVSPSTAMTAPSIATAITAFPPLPTIAHPQSESGHDLTSQGATAPHSELCEGAATFQTTDTSYTEMGPYENTYTTTTGEPPPQYAPALAEEQEQPYVTAYAPAAQDQYLIPVSTPAPKTPPAPVQAPSPVRALLKRKASSQSPNIRSRGRSPMGHLPYQEDIVREEKIKSRRSSVFSGLSSSPSSTPRPSSPVLQTLTFITYPDLEPKGHGRGGDCDGDDDDEGSPRRGRRGKKQPKKEPFLACYFCRGRKIACHPKNDGGEDRTCTQCAKRRLECKYPHISRRGQRKPHDPDADADADATTTTCKPRAAARPSKRSVSSHARM